jgi:hypothetical protein
MLVSTVENLRHNRLIPIGRNDKVNVSWTHGMSVQQLQQLPGRAVVRDLFDKSQWECSTKDISQLTG